MSQLCAPVRDEEIANLRTITDLVPLFRGILETLDVMKLDMSNFYVQQVQTDQDIKVKFLVYVDCFASSGSSIDCVQRSGV